MYHEGMTPAFKVTIDQDKRIGASFIEAAAVKDLVVTHDVVFAKPGVKPLKYDVFSPKGARNLPIIVIVHGGGWAANDEDVMRGLARELTKGRPVRSRQHGLSLGRQGRRRRHRQHDGQPDRRRVRRHRAHHGARGAVRRRSGADRRDRRQRRRTSLGAASLMTNMIGSRGFGKTPGVFEFMPTYLPKGKTAEQVRDEMLKAIKAAAPSYGVFGGTLLNPYSDEHADGSGVEGRHRAARHIPRRPSDPCRSSSRAARETAHPGRRVKEFVDALVKAGQRVEYVQVGGAGHAFFDWKPDETTKATFAKVRRLLRGGDEELLLVRTVLSGPPPGAPHPKRHLGLLCA
jgi:dienelactone hydrolase